MNIYCLKMTHTNFTFFKNCNALRAPETNPEAPLQTIDLSNDKTRNVPLALVTDPDGSNPRWQLKTYDLEMGGEDPPFLCDKGQRYFIAMQSGLVAEAGEVITTNCTGCLLVNDCLPKARMNATHAGIQIEAFRETNPA